MGILFLPYNAILAVAFIVLGVGIFRKNIVARYIAAVLTGLYIVALCVGLGKLDKFVKSLHDQIAAVEYDPDKAQIFVPADFQVATIELKDLPEGAKKVTEPKKGYMITVMMAEKLIETAPKQKLHFYFPIALNSLIIMALVAPEVARKARKLFLKQQAGQPEGPDPDSG
jgi:hypothetical protein